MVVTDELLAVRETLEALERRMEAAARRIGEGLPDEPDFHEYYRMWRAGVRADAEYQTARAEWEVVRWRYSE